MTDYEKLYQEKHDACGEPFPEFVDFFEKYDKKNAKILDLGCGQGRDVLFIARHGHSVLGVDTSQTGISQMLREANQNNLKVEGIVANISDFIPAHHYDIILMDRVLHMLQDDAKRLDVLQKSSETINSSGFILIADTPKHQSLILSFFDALKTNWKIIKKKKGFVFVQRS